MADQRPLPPALPQPGKDTSAWEHLTADKQQKADEQQKEESDDD